MKSFICAVVLSLFVALCPEAEPFPVGGVAPSSFLPSNLCTSTITPTPGVASATLTDSHTNHWQYPSTTSADVNGNFNINLNGVNYGKGASVLTGLTPAPVEVDFDIKPIGGPFIPWYQRNNGNDNLYQVSNCGQTLPTAPFTNTTTSVNYQSSGDMVVASLPNAHLQANAMPTGITAWIDTNDNTAGPLTIQTPGVVYACATGVAFWATAASGPGQGIAAIEANNVTINGCEFAYALSKSNNGPYRGINIDANNTGFTLNGGYFHDSDFGIQSGGNIGVVTLNNMQLDHNGNTSVNLSAPAHNIYLSWSQNTPDSSRDVINGGYSVCVGNNDAGTAGFEVKSRHDFMQMTNFTAAAPSQHGYTDCMESAAIDFSCGGFEIVGGVAAGTGVVVEVGPNLGTNGNELIRSYREESSTGNCPTGGWQNSDCQAATLQMLGSSQGCSLTVQNAWIINDSGENIKVITLGTTLPTGYTATVKNSKIVCGAASPCNSTFLGSGVTDGGGNTYFASRAAAGLGTCSSLSNCPLPPVP